MKKLIIISVIVLGLLSSLHVGLAQSPTASQIIEGTGNSPGASLTIQRVYTIVLSLACWLAQISLGILVIAFVFYGLMFFWAQGSPEAFTTAKKAFGWGLVGALVILGAYTIIATVVVAVDPGGANLDYNIILQPFSGCSSLVSQIN